MANFKKRIIGLTGGISTGKTTVSNYLAKTYKIPILDADIYAREAVSKNSPIWQKIFSRYGKQIIHWDGELNRQRLGEIIFNNPQEKQWLEKQIHPFVYNCFVKNIKLTDAPTIVLSIPLLFEAKMANLVTEIWVVICSYSQQIYRLQKRNNLTEEQAIARIKNQLALEKKAALADIVLDNNGDINSLFQQIDKFINLTKITEVTQNK
jgi:dephospho-CoA kinase